MPDQTVNTPRQAVEAILRQAPRTLQYDIVLGEEMLTVAERHLATLVYEDLDFFFSAARRLDEIWRSHILSVLLFDESVGAMDEVEEDAYRREYYGSFAESMEEGV